MPGRGSSAFAPISSCPSSPAIVVFYIRRIHRLAIVYLGVLDIRTVQRNARIQVTITLLRHPRRGARYLGLGRSRADEPDHPMTAFILLSSDGFRSIHSYDFSRSPARDFVNPRAERESTYAREIVVNPCRLIRVIGQLCRCFRETKGACSCVWRDFSSRRRGILRCIMIANRSPRKAKRTWCSLLISIRSLSLACTRVKNPAALSSREWHSSGNGDDDCPAAFTYSSRSQPRILPTTNAKARRARYANRLGVAIVSRED